jgi:hypothetical protein
MADLESSLKELEAFLKNWFKDAIIWDQNGTSLVGKYLYLRFEQAKIGLFIGYLLDQESKIKACVAFIFPHPSLSLSSDESGMTRRLFYRILIRSNLKLNGNPYRMVNGRKSPTIIRTLFFNDKNNDGINSSLQFFTESMSAIKQYQPVYRVVA